MKEYLRWNYDDHHIFTNESNLNNPPGVDDMLLNK